LKVILFIFFFDLIMYKRQFLENVFIEQNEKVPDKLWDDEEFVWNAVQWNGFNLKYASERLKKDKRFIIKIIKYSGYSFKYADDDLKKDKKFVIEIIKFNKGIFNYIDNELKDNEEILRNI